MDDGTELYSLPLRPGRPDRLDLRRSALKRWLDGLPLANLGWTSGSLYETLRLANLAPPPPAERLAFLETLRPTFCYVILRLRRLYGFRGFPPPARSQEIRGFVLALLEEVLRHYRGVIDGLVAQRRLGNRRSLALSLQRSVRCLSGQLIEHYRFYQPAPPGLWRALHALYREAQELDALHLAVPDDGLVGRGRCTVNRAYKQILLLAAMEPGQLRHQELDPIFGALKTVAGAAALHPARSGPMPQHCLQICPGDLGPRRAADLADPPAGSLWLDYARILAPSSPAARPRRRRPVPPALMERIRERLACTYRPRSERERANDRLDAVIGLAAVQNLLMQRPATVADEEMDEEAVDVDEGRWEYDPLQEQWRQVTDSPPQPEDEAPDEVEPARTLSLRVLDRSLRGYAFLLRADEPAALRLGDAVAARPPHCDEQEPWRIGLVRWLRAEPSGLRFGVEMLEAIAAPALALPADARPEDSPSRCLLLTEAARPGGVRHTLLLPHLRLAPGKRLRLWKGEEEIEVALGAELPGSGVCQRFEFRRAGAEPAAAVEKPTAETDGFRRLYSAL